MAFIAKQEVSFTPRQKVKGPKCGQCEEKKAAVVRSLTDCFDGGKGVGMGVYLNKILLAV